MRNRFFIFIGGSGGVELMAAEQKNFEKWSSRCGRVTLYRGDCLDVMPSLDVDSVDSVICDPPYGIRFMDSKWDHGVPGVPFWEAARRVMKPGAMLLAFGGTRTFHRLTCAIEDAGFEIRDCLMWLYGSGFPKSLDISKAIDGAAGAEREVVGEKTSRQPTGVAYAQDKWTKEHGVRQNIDITVPSTPDAQTWDGWGTALKPAFEPITLSMKPLDGTFAANALKYGVAGLDIDGGRIDFSSDKDEEESKNKNQHSDFGSGPIRNSIFGRFSKDRENYNPPGRWPANVILDEAAAAELDVQSGMLPPRKERMQFQKARPASKAKGQEYENWTYNPCALAGGASRFFYVAKPSKSERNAGLDTENHHPTVKPIALLRYLARLTKTPSGGNVLDPFMGSGSTGVAAILEGRAFIGIEKEEEYFEIAKRRLALALAESQSDMLAGMEVV